MRQNVTVQGTNNMHSHLYTVVRSYCANDDARNGLFLIDMPTGFGKTHAVLDYIYEAACDDRFKDRKIFFITTLKKNLPSEELKERFSQAGRLDLYKEKFLFVDSNADCAISNFTSDIAKAIPSDIKRSEEYRLFSQDAQFLKTQQDKRDFSLTQALASIRDNFRRITEPNFRRYIQRLLAKEFKTVDDKLYAIKTDSKWQWLGALYPAVFTRERQIIFMSMDKFLSQYSTIVEPSSMIYNSSIIKDALVFIDEFDATKETILKNIIQNGLRDKIDYLNLFREIYAALQTSRFPRSLTTPSKQRQSGPYKDQSLQSIIDDIKGKAEDIYNEYSLQFSHKTADDLVDTSRNFLFQDHQFHSILDADRSYIVTTSDSDRQINTICFSKERPDSENNNIQFMLGKLRGFIKYFQGGVNILAINYLQCKTEQRKNGEDAFTMESAIRSVLTEFSLSDFHKDYLTAQILISSHKNTETIEGPQFDLSLYEHGFRYYAFLDEPSHDMRSQIMMYGFQNTPEKYLLRFCEKAKVIGISATATIPSVLGNFDIGYLKSKMQSAFTTLSDTDREALAAEFDRANAGYGNINIITNLIDGKVNGQYGLDSWKNVFEDDEIAEYAFSRVEQALSSENNSYNKERYLRIVSAYKAFWAHEDIQSFLCVLTMHPRSKNAVLDLVLLLELFDWIHGAKGEAKKHVCQLDGEEYDIKKDKIQERLKKGEKLFVISVYQTIGAGQNIQYGIPKGGLSDIIAINSFPSRDEKDFDAIYLDKPTNVVANITENMPEEDFVRYLFQTEFLQETSEISAQEAFAHIKKAFMSFYSGHVAKMWATPIYDCKSTRMLYTRTIIQAIGRICRTNQKKKNIYIYADARLSECIDPSVDEGRLMNSEFKSLLDVLKQQKIKPVEQKNLEEAGALLSVKANKFINNILGEKWTDERVNQWKTLRELVLKHPTISADDVSKSFIAKNFYVELPNLSNRLWYSQEADFNNIKVSFDNANGYYEVSAEAARLNRLMRIPGVKEHFEENGYATSFSENSFIMSPTLFNNIYKGALGEVIGRYLLEQKLGIALEEIEAVELFEKFDFKVAGKAAYVDFKHWAESTQFDADEMYRKITTKAKTCCAKAVLVINILSDNAYEKTLVECDGIKILEIPALVGLNEGGNYAMKYVRTIREVLNGLSD